MPRNQDRFFSLNVECIILDSAMILGLATTDLILYVLLILVIIQIVWVIRLELRIRAFTKGKSGASLEDSMGQLNKLLDRLFSHTEEMGKKIENHDKRLKRSIQGLSTIRFNPFASEGQGSNQSFATAFLNEEGDGV